MRTRWRPFPRLWWGFGLILLALTLDAVAAEKKADLAPVKELLAKLAEATGGEIWALSRQLEQVPEAARGEIRAALKSDRPRVVLACARALAVSGDRAAALPALLGLARRAGEGKAPQELGLQAIELIARHCRGIQAEVQLLNYLGIGSAPAVKTWPPALEDALAGALYVCATTEEAQRQAATILHRHLEAKDPSLRWQAALALATAGSLNEDVQRVVEEVAAEPTPRGDLARTLLRLDKVRGELRAPYFLMRHALRDPLLHEILGYVRRFHVEEPKKIEALRDAAAAGLASALDPFTAYLDPSEWKRFREAMSGKYAGVGARVQFIRTDEDTGIFTLVEVFYSGPAYQVGLRTFDEVIEISGKKTKGQDLTELVEQLKGIPGTPVEIKIRRDGEKDLRAFRIERREISVPTLYSGMLPGRIGYVHLVSFGRDTAKELDEALTKLERAGTRGLILDLRGNPGGLLNVAVAVADLFLANDKLIVTSRGRSPQIAPEEKLYTTDPATHPNYPLVVLVSRSSASASEIVAGALQDHKRALLVGERTYGKGSVQRTFGLRTAGNRSILKLTIAKYYLPNGRCIHRTKSERGGVMPDVVIRPNRGMAYWIDQDFTHLRRQGAFAAYLEAHWDKVRRKLVDLSHFDEGKPENYPGFDAWHHQHAADQRADRARRLLRSWLRVFIADQQAKRPLYDIQQDKQLQRAILELGKKLEGFDFAAVREYQWMLEQPKEGDL